MQRGALLQSLIAVDPYLIAVRAFDNVDNIFGIAA